MARPPTFTKCMPRFNERSANRASDSSRFRFGSSPFTESRFLPAALISVATPEIFPATALIRLVDRRRRKKVAGLKDNRPAMIVLKGLQGPVTVKGQKFGSAVMQPWDKTLTDQKIADVLTYERSEWGNSASPVTAEQIAALRKELANHPDSYTEPDVLAVPADAELPGGAPAGAAPPKPGEAAKPGGSPPPPPKS